MAPGLDKADWMSNPQDKINLMEFFVSIKVSMGQGGNWDKEIYAQVAVHMAKKGPLLKGRPKTADSIKSQWGSVRHYTILQCS
jgi:hypothetical protein